MSLKKRVARVGRVPRRGICEVSVSPVNPNKLGLLNKNGGEGGICEVPVSPVNPNKLGLLNKNGGEGGI
ncbi:MAG: hypothetical protein C0410_10520 [Anaerolinea sp.]|nr:hypothetical protein [Anaerolinea sp.]